MDWEDLNIILAVGRAGSLSGAAERLGVNHSTVFRRVNTIEKKLRVRFFERLPSGYILTQAGEMAFRTAEQIDTQVLELSRELMGKDLRLQGKIRITAPEGLSVKLLDPILASFCKQHPAIQIELITTGQTLQLARREADLAIRVTNNPPETSIGRKVSDFGFGIYATKSYLKKHPERDLASMDWIVTEDSRDWFSAAFWKKLGQPRARIVFNSNSTMAVFNAAKQSLGVAPLPCFMGDTEKKLERVIDLLPQMRLQLWLLTHPDLRHTVRIKALMQFLITELSKKEALLSG